MKDELPGFTVLHEVTWRPSSQAVFKTLAATIEDRFGPPSERDIDSNGLGLFDGHLLRFACGLEVTLCRYHLTGWRTIDPAVEPSTYEIYANEHDAEHIAFHLHVATELMGLWVDRVGRPLLSTSPCNFVVMRTDDNGNEAEVKAMTNRCEAEALVREYEARGHKQLYWILDRTSVPRDCT